ncbi:MAG: Fic family protein, partial [Gammaproteobacteria bacterium]
APGNPEGEFQPGSNEQVLRNKLGITNPDEMENIEFDALIDFQTGLFNILATDQKISVADLCNWHKQWLGDIYEWAGDYRAVNLSRDGYVFAAAHLVPNLMGDFDRKVLAESTPCYGLTREQLITAMAISHVEFIIIHPFRDGNGRLGRLLSTVMALQAGMPVLNYEPVEKDKASYIAAIHAGHAGDYTPMQAIFSEVLDYSLQYSD